jgi:hypothetical protein
MKKFKLITKSNETINIVNIETIGEAIRYFAEIKKLTVDMLLSVYKVVSE